MLKPLQEAMLVATYPLFRLLRVLRPLRVLHPLRVLLLLFSHNLFIFFSCNFSHSWSCLSFSSQLRVLLLLFSHNLSCSSLAASHIPDPTYPSLPFAVLSSSQPVFSSFLNLLAASTSKNSMGESSSGILALNRNNGRNRTSVLPDFLLKICPTETSWLVAWIEILELENPVQKKILKNEPEDNSAGPEENIDDSSQQQLDVACQSNSSSTVRRRRNRCPGKNGRTCHQCHQKTLDFVASCKSGREEMPCTKVYCVKCIRNRYGDKVEVAHPLNNWRRPSCRWICNCGRCMKEREFQSAGIRGHLGKTARFPSVMERLATNSSKNSMEWVDRTETSTTEESVPGSDRRKDAGSSKSMEVHLSSEVNPRVEVEEEKSERAGGKWKDISDAIKTVSSRNDVLSVLLSPSRADYESLLQPSHSV